jgi:hypothetical protein
MGSRNLQIYSVDKLIVYQNLKLHFVRKSENKDLELFENIHFKAWPVNGHLLGLCNLHTINNEFAKNLGTLSLALGFFNFTRRISLDIPLYQIEEYILAVVALMDL